MRIMLAILTLLGLGLILATAPALKPPAALAQAPAPAQGAPEPIRDSHGDALRNPRVLSFNGAVFQVEHDGGIAGIPWDRMPPALRTGYTYRPPLPPVRPAGPAKPPIAAGEDLLVAGVIQPTMEYSQWVIRATIPRGPSDANPSGPRRFPDIRAKILVPELQGLSGWRPNDAVTFRAQFHLQPDPKVPGGFLAQASNIRPWSEAPAAGPPSQPPPAANEVELNVPMSTPIRMRDYGGGNRAVTVLAEDIDAIRIAVTDYDKLVGGYRVAATYGSGQNGSPGYSPGYDVPPRPEVITKSVPRPPGFSGKRHLLHEEASGVKLYFEETLGTFHGHIRLVVVKRG